MAVDQNLVSYLESLLVQARKGGVVSFIGSASVVEVLPADLLSAQPSRVKVQVMVAATYEQENASRMETSSLEKCVAAGFDGAARAAASITDALRRDVDSRSKRSS